MARKNLYASIKEMKKGDRVIIGVAHPIIGSPIVSGDVKPIIKLIFKYNRSRTSIRVMYDKFFSLTDETIMPLRENDTIWICSKSDTEGELCFLEERVNVNGLGIVENVFTFKATKEGIEGIDEKYREYAEYVVNKFYN